MRVFVFLACFSVTAFGQTTKRPKLMVGVVVDQMRQEYLYRYEGKFGEGGFKRLMREGFMMKNAHYNYAPTVTGPGHASVYTGTTPGVHGIIGNDYYDKQEKQMVYCVEDPNQKPVGGTGNGVSPWRMLSTTITDELELSTNKKAKVIAASIKDRSAVLPAGHMADAAYFPEGRGGNFITSTFYRSDLPDWVNKFNARGLPAQYLSKPWTPLLPIEQYTESGPDDSPYERKLKGKEKMTFPYDFMDMVAKGSGGEVFAYSPYANDYLTEFAKAAITGEQMGKDDVPDFLAVSYSSTDILGHSVGPRAVELEDMYIRLDKNLEDLLKTLDKEVGAGNYTLFLSADHAVADVPQYLKDNKVPAGYFNEEHALVKLNEYLATFYPGKKLVEKVSNEQVFLNHAAFDGDPRTSGLDMFVVAELAGKFLMTMEGVTNYYTEAVIKQSDFNEGGIKGKIVRGHHPKRSGDLAYVMEPGWIESGSVTGTTHGSPYSYDTHIPMLFFGCGVKQGSSVEFHPVTDIAPTAAVILKTMFPSGCTGQPISELLKD